MRSEIATATWRAAGLAAVSFVAACSGASDGGKGSGGANGTAVNGRGGSSASAGTAGSDSNTQPGDLPVCDTAENNLSVWGFGETPWTMSGTTPVLGLTGPVPGAAYVGLLFQAATDGGAVVSVNITSSSALIASGKDLILGSGTKVQVYGLVSTSAGSTNFSCTGDSGEVRINNLSVYQVSDQGPAKELPDEENVSFVVNCTGEGTKPVGVVQVHGCYNLAK